MDEELRKKKVEALKQQAAERAKVLQENMEKRRMELDAQQDMKVHDAKVLQVIIYSFVQSDGRMAKTFATGAVYFNVCFHSFPA